jgi:hypothetical protein
MADLYLSSWKIERRHYTIDLTAPTGKKLKLKTDEECDLAEDEEEAWRRDNPPLTDYQARKLMGLLPPEDAVRGRLDKEAIKQRADIVEVYRQLHPQLKIVERGRFVTAQCFMHDDKKPSLSINKDRGLWYCHSNCQEGGDVIALVMKSLDLPFIAALSRLDEIC